MNFENCPKMSARGFAQICSQKFFNLLGSIPDCVGDLPPMEERNPLDAPVCSSVWPYEESYTVPLFAGLREKMLAAIVDENGEEKDNWEFPCEVRLSGEMGAHGAVWLRLHVKMLDEIGWIYTYGTEHFCEKHAETFAGHAIAALKKVKKLSREHEV